MRRYFVVGAAVALLVCAGILVPWFTHGRVTHPRVTRHVYPFSLTFAGTVNAYGRAHGKPLIRKVTCLQGNPGHYACAYVYKGGCRMAWVDYRDGAVDVQKAGKIGWLSAATCTARNAFRYAWKG